jgi:hypothetical protein
MMSGFRRGVHGSWVSAVRHYPSRGPFTSNQIYLLLLVLRQNFSRGYKERCGIPSKTQRSYSNSVLSPGNRNFHRSILGSQTGYANILYPVKCCVGYFYLPLILNSPKSGTVSHHLANIKIFPVEVSTNSPPSLMFLKVKLCSLQPHCLSV